MKFLDQARTWAESHTDLLGWLLAASGATFLLSLIAVPLVIVMVPHDVFVRSTRDHSFSLGRLLWIVLRNVLGWILLLGGILMLILPGQGLLTIVIGLALLDFPRKRILLGKLVSLKGVRRPIRWLRKRAGKKELLLPRKES